MPSAAHAQMTIEFRGAWKIRAKSILLYLPCLVWQPPDWVCQWVLTGIEYRVARGPWMPVVFENVVEEFEEDEAVS